MLAVQLKEDKLNIIKGNQGRWSLLMPNNNHVQSPKTTIIIAFSRGKIEIENIDFLKFFLEKFFLSATKLIPLIESFEKTKKEPTKKNIDNFYFDIIKRIDPEYNFIDNFEDFLIVFQKSQNLIDFVNFQPDSFKLEMLEYLSS